MGERPASGKGEGLRAPPPFANDSPGSFRFNGDGTLRLVLVWSLEASCGPAVLEDEYLLLTNGGIDTVREEPLTFEAVFVLDPFVLVVFLNLIVFSEPFFAVLIRR